MFHSVHFCLPPLSVTRPRWLLYPCNCYHSQWIKMHIYLGTGFGRALRWLCYGRSDVFRGPSDVLGDGWRRAGGVLGRLSGVACRAARDVVDLVWVWMWVGGGWGWGGSSVQWRRMMHVNILQFTTHQLSCNHRCTYRLHHDMSAQSMVMVKSPRCQHALPQLCDRAPLGQCSSPLRTALSRQWAQYYGW